MLFSILSSFKGFLGSPHFWKLKNHKHSVISPYVFGLTHKVWVTYTQSMDFGDVTYFISCYNACSLAIKTTFSFDQYHNFN